MAWYEHLLGILAMISCFMSLIVGIPAIAAVRVGAISDIRLAKIHQKECEAVIREGPLTSLDKKL